MASLTPRPPAPDPSPPAPAERGRCFVLDPSVRRVGDGRVLIGGSPLVLLRLTQAGADVIDRISRGGAVGHSSAIDALLDRLLDAGVAHPIPHTVDRADEVSVVIPALNTPPQTLREMVDACEGVAAVIIVDDASATPIPPIAGATVIRHASNRGPGAARGTGAAMVATPFVAFVDTDVVLRPGWLDALLGHFDDPHLAAVAPRVAAAPGSTLIHRYEMSRSPLDLGPSPARVLPGSRVAYVPSAALVVRTKAFHDASGFDETLRVGEDVDLIWRLIEAGHRVRLQPASTVHHQPRADLRAWMAQRFSYGSSAAALERRHPGALAPVRVSGWSAAIWIAVAAGFPLVGAAIAAGTTALLARKLRHVPDGPKQAVRLAGLGHLFAARSLASGLTRAWWPFAAVAAIFSGRCRRILVVAAVAPAAFDWLRTEPDVDLATYVGLRVLDDMSYGAGLLQGVVIERSIASILPDLRSWPNTSRR